MDIFLISPLTHSQLVATCRLLITFANSLDPDQVGQNWILKLFDTDSIPESFFEKVNLKKKHPQTTKKHVKLPSMQRIKNVVGIYSLDSGEAPKTFFMEK